MIMGIFDLFTKNKHKAWVLMPANDPSAFYKGFTAQQLRDTILNIDVERIIRIYPKLPFTECCNIIYEKNETTQKLCLKANFEQEDGHRSYILSDVMPEDAYRIIEDYVERNIAPDIGAWKLESYLKNMSDNSFLEFVKLFTKDSGILKRMTECTKDPFGYLKDHKEILPPDDITEEFNESEYRNILEDGKSRKNREYILLNAFAYEMYGAGLMSRTFVLPECDDFIAAMEPLAKKNKLPFEKNWLDPDTDEADWCMTLEEKWRYDGYVIIEPYTRSFCTYNYICTYEEKEEIIRAASDAGIEIITSEDK